MLPETVAAKIYLLQRSDQDRMLILMEITKLLQSSDIDLVQTAYKQILRNKLKVVAVKTSFELSEAETKKLENKITKKLDMEEVVFAYQVDESVKTGIEIKLGDTLIELEK